LLGADYWPTDNRPVLCWCISSYCCIVFADKWLAYLHTSTSLVKPLLVASPQKPSYCQFLSYKYYRPNDLSLVSCLFWYIQSLASFSGVHHHTFGFHTIYEKCRNCYIDNVVQSAGPQKGFQEMPGDSCDSIKLTCYFLADTQRTMSSFCEYVQQKLLLKFFVEPTLLLQNRSDRARISRPLGFFDQVFFTGLTPFLSSKLMHWIAIEETVRQRALCKFYTGRLCMLLYRADKSNIADTIDAVTSWSAAQVAMRSAGYGVDQPGRHPDEDVVAETVTATQHCPSWHQPCHGRGDGWWSRMLLAMLLLLLSQV